MSNTVGTGYSFVWAGNLRKEDRNTLTPMSKQKKCGGCGGGGKTIEMQRCKNGGEKLKKDRFWLQKETVCLRAQ